MMVKSGLDFFYFEIEQAPSKIPSYLPGQSSLSGPIFFCTGQQQHFKPKIVISRVKSFLH
jgi:hypothetical protein